MEKMISNCIMYCKDSVKRVEGWMKAIVAIDEATK
jgi:hypothetical protein